LNIIRYRVRRSEKKSIGPKRNVVELSTTLLLLRLIASEHTANEVARALDAISSLVSNGLAAVCDSTDGTVGCLGAGKVGRRVAALVVLALALGAVETLLGGKVADWLKESALTNLPGGQVVHAILQSVDLVNASDLCLVEVLYTGVLVTR
jgi:hypothetical protein